MPSKRAEACTFKTVPCRSCGKPVVMARNKATGNLIPLDVDTQVYLTARENGEITCEATAWRLMISHFSVCPDATKHSKRNARS